MPINKQPLFAGTIRLVTLTFDPPIITDNYLTAGGNWGTGPQNVYTATGTYGDIVDRITISATGDLTNTTVNAKLIYVYLGDGGDFSLYKTLAMPATTVSSTTPNPELELTFQGGLLLKPNDTIRIGASENYNNSSDRGDNISVTIEGGTYDGQ